jgi:hypothetical protein
MFKNYFHCPISHRKLSVFVTRRRKQFLKRSVCVIWGNGNGFVSFHSLYLFYLLTVGVEGVYLHLIALTQAPQSVGLLWTRDRPVPETDNTNTQKRQTSMPPVGFEPTIPGSARPQSYALDCEATGIGMEIVLKNISDILHPGSYPADA